MEEEKSIEERLEALEKKMLVLLSKIDPLDNIVYPIENKHQMRKALTRILKDLGLIEVD